MWIEQFFKKNFPLLFYCMCRKNELLTFFRSENLNGTTKYNLQLKRWKRIENSNPHQNGIVHEKHVGKKFCNQFLKSKIEVDYWRNVYHCHLTFIVGIYFSLHFFLWKLKNFFFLFYFGDIDDERGENLSYGIYWVFYEL